MDGMGVGEQNDGNFLWSAHPPSLEYVQKNYPSTALEASGIAVGLPWGEPGNSEVGHVTLGAGTIIYQNYPKISIAVRDGSFFNNLVLTEAFNHAVSRSTTVHLIGTLSSSNNHSSLEHIKALVKMALAKNAPRVKFHFFADGKDAPPGNIRDLIKEVPREFLGTIAGRYFAMDHELRWQLTRQIYDLLTQNGAADDYERAIENVIAKNGSEEFLPPTRCSADSAIGDGDAIIFFNFREDGVRQIAEAFAVPDFQKFPTVHFKNIYFCTMTAYGKRFSVPVAFPEDVISKSVGETVSLAGRTQLRLAETSKYAHVTYFFNGYREAAFKNEFRVLVPSGESSAIIEKPEMMAPAITDRLLQSISSSAFDLIVANYANLDAMAHSGDLGAAAAAVSVIDEQVSKIIRAAEREPVSVIITSDHGNIERMINPLTGRVERGHDASPVPFYLLDRRFKGLQFARYSGRPTETAGTIADVAPTILQLMDVALPQEMTGVSLMAHL